MSKPKTGESVIRWLWAEVRHAVVMAGYWIRPYDSPADRRRWRWQPREPCQYYDQAGVLRRWLAERDRGET